MNIKNHKTTFGASLAALAFSTMLTPTAQAQTCTTVPSCSTLGYTKSASDCSGLDYLRCPFDQSKYFCTEGSGSSSGGGGGGYIPPAHEWKGSLTAAYPIYPRCAEFKGTYQLEIKLSNLRCKLSTGTIIFNDRTLNRGSFPNEDKCYEELSDSYDTINQLERQSDGSVTVGVCNSLTDYEITL